MKIKEELNKLKSVDIYSLMLFALFKIRDIPEYSSLSELAYVLDKNNLLKLCEYFGGLTIKIPTISDLESMVYTLVLYQLVDIDGMEYDDAVKQIGHNSSDLRRVKSDYIKMKNILDNYNFSRK
jgi:hypothetical protein